MDVSKNSGTPKAPILIMVYTPSNLGYPLFFETPIYDCICKCKCHRENDGTLGMVPLIINPIYTLYSGYLLDVFIG